MPSPDNRVIAQRFRGFLPVVIDVETGGFDSGDQPHENAYSEDGERIYHASIGKVFVPMWFCVLIVELRAFAAKAKAD